VRDDNLAPRNLEGPKLVDDFVYILKRLRMDVSTNGPLSIKLKNATLQLSIWRTNLGEKIQHGDKAATGAISAPVD
jgi:hypothetical protein